MNLKTFQTIVHIHLEWGASMSCRNYTPLIPQACLKCLVHTILFSICAEKNNYENDYAKNQVELYFVLFAKSTSNYHTFTQY